MHGHYTANKNEGRDSPESLLADRGYVRASVLPRSRVQSSRGL